MSFRNLHLIHRRGLSFRAPSVLPLAGYGSNALSDWPSLAGLLQDPSFCALVIAQQDRIVLEHHAADFGTDQLHSMQSITKTIVHLALGQLVTEGRVDPRSPIGAFVPEAGDAYAQASVQQALDMDITSNFVEDYTAPYSPRPERGAPVGYARQEIAMGWRLPPDGEAEFGVRRFAAELVATRRGSEDQATLYASPNTDILGWVVERASGRRLTEHIEAIVAAAGLAGSFHISTDCEGIPVLSGGGMMTARDLARYGLLLAGGGSGIDGRSTGNTAFLADTMCGAGTRYRGSPRLRYRNHLLTNGTWIGHPGYAGQFLMVDPVTRAAAAFFSVLETEAGDREGYFAEIMAALSGALERLR